MRTFVAVVPPPEALAPLVAAIERLRGTYAASWVPAERLHVTLSFLGEVSEDTAAKVADGLRESVADADPFRLRVAGGGAFPRDRRARVLWAGLDGEIDALSRLAAFVRYAVDEAGVDTDDKAFVPHVTVARLRRPADVTGAVEALTLVVGDEWLVGEVVLMRSVLGPAPAYEPLARAPLGYQA